MSDEKKPWVKRMENKRHLWRAFSTTEGGACELTPDDVYAIAFSDGRADALKSVKRLVAAAEEVSCQCSINERISGHKTDCNIPMLTEALEKFKKETE